MERFQTVLLDVWREVCRHLEIRESAGRIAQLLAPRLPLELLLVRRIDRQHLSVDTVASGRPAAGPLPAASRTACTAADMNRLTAWVREGRILSRAKPSRRGLSTLIIPAEVEGEALAGPLCGGEGSAGVLILATPPGRSFAAEHQPMIKMLLEPFAAALENDCRLHELAALREAAEADRRSLLSRLGRQEIAETIVGDDGGLRPVMQRVALAAPSDVPVLIFGETGTGKELVARAIHSRSTRAVGPFIRVNCGAIPPELIDSQLFGHERGSFTGATETRQGWFERADGGTLFLDEIGDLPLPAQVRLLRVLQDGYLERVGGAQPIRVDVRIVAATHRDLPAMIQAGSFREDLWYRLAVFTILLPRLRERLEDIPALAEHFAQRAAHRFGLALVAPTPENLGLLRQYPWPGNIRELASVIDRAAILGDGRTLEVAAALGGGMLGKSAADMTNPRTDAVRSERGAAAELVTLDEAMRRHIAQALAATRGRIEGANGAAAILGINPHTLRARMRKLGVEWSKFRSLAWKGG